MGSLFNVSNAQKYRQIAKPLTKVSGMCPTVDRELGDRPALQSGLVTFRCTPAYKSSERCMRYNKYSYNI